MLIRRRRSRQRMSARAAWAALVTVLLAALSLTVTSPASAATYPTQVYAGNNVRAGASTSFRVVATTTSTARMQCWRDLQVVSGSPRWFLVELSNGQEGFIHSSLTVPSTQTSTPKCDTLQRVRAADWALAQLGKTYDDTGRQVTWAPGPDKEWSGDCLAFVNHSYRIAGHTGLGAATAIGQWNSPPAGAIKMTGLLPRYGDPVFTNIPSVGHTAIYIGGTSMIGTQGVDGSRLPIEIYSLYNKYPTYQGYLKLGS